MASLRTSRMLSCGRSAHSVPILVTVSFSRSSTLPFAGNNDGDLQAPVRRLPGNPDCAAAKQSTSQGPWTSRIWVQPLILRGYVVAGFRHPIGVKALLDLPQPVRVVRGMRSEEIVLEVVEEVVRESVVPVDRVGVCLAHVFHGGSGDIRGRSPTQKHFRVSELALLQ